MDPTDASAPDSNASDEHQEARTLLPWYVTGRLSAQERDRIDAHLLTCVSCRTEAQSEARLRRAVASLSFDLERGLVRQAAKLGGAARGRAGPSLPPWLDLSPLWGWIRQAPGHGAGLAVPLGAGLALGVLMMSASPRQAAYHALGAPPPAAAGNLIVMFRPEATTRQVREALDAAQARIVDGPTVTGAYVLHVDIAQRATGLARLKAGGAVTLAEPLDPGAGR
jgi:anti-sigma factor RsiW